MLRGSLTNAGQRIELECSINWAAGILREGAAGALRPAGHGETADIRVQVERSRAPFDLTALERLGRDAWYRDGEVVIRDVSGAGFDLRLRISADAPPVFSYRWRPSPRARAAAVALRGRFHLQVRTVILRFPALWWAGTTGKVPLHASVFTAGSRTPMLAGPGGVGKSTLLAKELAAGGTATCDNICVSDGWTAFGVVEPLRVEGGSGRRMDHGRREVVMERRVPALSPNLLLALRRGGSEGFEVEPIDAAAAARVLVTGTYMAKELRRYWGFAATLAAATGLGPAHPPIAEIAARIANELPAALVGLPNRPGPRLTEMLDEKELGWTQRS